MGWKPTVLSKSFFSGWSCGKKPLRSPQRLWFLPCGQSWLRPLSSIWHHWSLLPSWNCLHLPAGAQVSLVSLLPPAAPAQSPVGSSSFPWHLNICDVSWPLCFYIPPLPFICSSLCHRRPSSSGCVPRCPCQLASTGYSQLEELKEDGGGSPGCYLQQQLHFSSPRLHLLEACQSSVSVRGPAPHHPACVTRSLCSHTTWLCRKPGASKRSC